MSKAFQIIKNYILSLGWTLVILILTTIPGKAIPEVSIIGIDKLVHCFIFGLLTFLTAFDLKNHGSNAKPLRTAVIYSISYGIFIELIQNFVPGRSCSIYDVIANSLGALIGYLCFKYYSK